MTEEKHGPQKKLFSVFLDKVNSDLQKNIKVICYESARHERINPNTNIRIDISKPIGYNAIGIVGITTNGFISSTYAYIYDSFLDVWLVEGGGPGTVAVSVLYQRQ